MIIANFIPGYDEITSDKLIQWDYGQQLHIYGLEDLPEIIEVHFCDRTCDKAIVRMANKVNTHFEVAIPDRLLENEYDISAFIYVNANTAGQTVKTIHTPVVQRKQPENYVDPGDPTVSDKLTVLENHVSALDAKFARVYGTKDEGLDIQVCDVLPPEVDRKPNVLYIAPDNMSATITEIQENIQSIKTSIVTLKKTINDVGDTSLRNNYAPIRLANKLKGLIDPQNAASVEGAAVDIAGKLERGRWYLITYKERTNTSGGSADPYELHTAIFYYQDNPTYEPGTPPVMHHIQWIDRRTMVDSNGKSHACGLQIYHSSEKGTVLGYKIIVETLDERYLYDVDAIPLTAPVLSHGPSGGLIR